MATTDVWKFSQHELIVALLKQAGVMEGRWSLAVNWTYAPHPMNFPSAEKSAGTWRDQKVPGFVTAVTGVEVQRIAPDFKPGPGDVIVDAATMEVVPTQPWPEGGNPSVLQ